MMHLASAGLVAAAALVSAQGSSSAASASASASRSGSATAAAPSSCYSGYAQEPLFQKRFDYPDGLPYKVETDTTACRGVQVGYNICNSTTEGQDSMCQTAFINSIDDFCLWGPPELGEEVGSIEGEMVAWCTKPGRGTRLIPEGALQGVQFLRAPAYVQVTGHIDQSKIDILPGDFGGEMDPHGADGKGNPMGGVLYSQAFSGGNANSAWRQVVEWHNFMGGNVFCLKACDPSNADGPKYCEHIFDRIGCHYNAPAAYVNGTFESCESDNQMFPGHYVSNGRTLTYTQPPESLGPISTMPYDPVPPASSQCTQYTSASIYSALPRVNAASSSTSAETTATSGTSAARSTSTAASSTRGVNAAGNAATTGSSSNTGAAARGTSTSMIGAAGLLAFIVVGAML